MEHTPGPWRDVSDTGDHPLGASLVMTSGRGFTGIDSTSIDCGISGQTLAECRANARLVAAAPDLLAALEDLVRAVESGAMDPGLQIDAAQRAISKARSLTPDSGANAKGEQS